jgi:hypothetical protein
MDSLSAINVLSGYFIYYDKCHHYIKRCIKPSDNIIKNVNLILIDILEMLSVFNEYRINLSMLFMYFLDTHNIKSDKCQGYGHIVRKSNKSNNIYHWNCKNKDLTIDRLSDKYYTHSNTQFNILCKDCKEKSFTITKMISEPMPYYKLVHFDWATMSHVTCTDSTICHICKTKTKKPFISPQFFMSVITDLNIFYQRKFITRFDIHPNQLFNIIYAIQILNSFADNLTEIINKISS